MAAFWFIYLFTYFSIYIYILSWVDWIHSYRVHRWEDLMLTLIASWLFSPSWPPTLILWFLQSTVLVRQEGKWRHSGVTPSHSVTHSRETTCRLQWEGSEQGHGKGSPAKTSFVNHSLLLKVSISEINKLWLEGNLPLISVKFMS